MTDRCRRRFPLPRLVVEYTEERAGSEKVPDCSGGVMMRMQAPLREPFKTMGILVPSSSFRSYLGS